jgi:hypothetical protein
VGVAEGVRGVVAIVALILALAVGISSVAGVILATVGS